MASGKAIGVGKEQARAGLAGEFTVDADQAGHARARLNKRLAMSGVRVPSFAHVARHHHHARALAIVAAVEHQYARLDFRHLRLGGIIIRARAHVPCFAVILGINDRAVRQTALVRRILILRGEHQRAVGHGDALAGTGENEAPFGLLHLRSDVDGLGPGPAVIVTAHEYELAGLLGIHSGAGTAPRTVAVTPGGGHPDGAGVAIDQHGRIADAVVAPFGIGAHVHDRTRRFPRPAAIGAARHAHINVARQIPTAAMAQIVHANQRALRRGSQPGDAAGVHAPLPALPHGYAEAMHRAGQRLQFVDGAIGKVSAEHIARTVRSMSARSLSWRDSQK